MMSLPDTASDLSRLRTCVDCLEKCIGGQTVRKLLGYSLENDEVPVSACLSRMITEIDQVLSRQMDEILHHPDFQRLESTWRGLSYLLSEGGRYLLPPPHSPGRTTFGKRNACVRIKILHARRDEWEYDFEYSTRFDRTHFWREVFAHEFDTLGGEPFGLVICDYEIKDLLSVRLMRDFSDAANGAFCPILFRAGPSLFDVADFSILSRHLPDWNPVVRNEIEEFRKMDAASFAAIFLPRIRLREPLALESTSLWPYREKFDTNQKKGALWGHPGWSYAAAIIGTFGETGWPYSLAGISEENANTALREKYSQRFMSGEVYIGDKTSRKLAEMGCVSSHADRIGKDVRFLRPVTMKRTESNFSKDSGWLPSASSLPAMLAVCRFAHYLKAVTRNTVGAPKTGIPAVRNLVSGWLKDYVSESESDTVRPLVKQSVEITEQSDNPGHYQAKIALWLKPAWGRKFTGEVDFRIKRLSE